MRYLLTIVLATGLCCCRLGYNQTDLAADAAADCSTKVFSDPGRMSVVLPTSCGSLMVRLCGAGGGAGPTASDVSQSAPGGAGGVLDLVLMPPSSPSLLTLFVGGKGVAGQAAVAGPGGGGGGGGATYITDDSGKILALAGAGGGAGGDPSGTSARATPGGAGGSMGNDVIAFGGEGQENSVCSGAFGGGGGFGGEATGGDGGCNGGGGGGGGGASGGMGGVLRQPGAGGASLILDANDLAFNEAGSGAIAPSACTELNAGHGGPAAMGIPADKAGDGAVVLEWQP